MVVTKSEATTFVARGHHGAPPRQRICLQRHTPPAIKQSQSERISNDHGTPFNPSRHVPDVLETRGGCFEEAIGRFRGERVHSSGGRVRSSPGGSSWERSLDNGCDSALSGSSEEACSRVGSLEPVHSTAPDSQDPGSEVCSFDCSFVQRIWYPLRISRPISSLGTRSVQYECSRYR